MSPLEPTYNDETMRTFWLTLAIVVAVSGSAWGLPNEVSYEIDARLNTDTNVITGEETLTLTNRTGGTLDELVFHLYPNAFRRGANTFYQQELRAKAGIDDLDVIYADPSDDAFMRIQRVSTSAQTLSYEIDDTLMTVELADPLPADGTIELGVEFTYNLMEIPSNGQYAGNLALRTGHREGVYTVTLWYPKLAVYDDEGWNRQRYGYIGEFYGDFGDYTVSLNVPSRMTVGATGQRQGQVAELGGVEPRKTLTYQADNVHDFAWVASERYHLTELTTDDGVAVQALTLNDGSDLARQTRDALVYFAEHFGPYAYETMVAADVTAGGGMEYPGIIMIGFGSIREIVHEVGHQWWYGAVGNDEYDEAWLDEAFTVYADERYRIEQLGLSERSTRSSFRFSEPGTPVLTPASGFPTIDRYFQAVYTKGSGVVWMLEGWLGRQTLDEVLQAYYERFRFQNVSTADFMATIEDVTGREMDDFFDLWLRTTETLDVYVDRVRALDSSEGSYRYAISVARDGRSFTPVTLKVADNAGGTTHLHWENSEDRQTFEVTLDAPLAEVILDPDQTLLEPNRTNNTWDAARQQAAQFPVWLGVLALAVVLPIAHWGWSRFRGV